MRLPNFPHIPEEERTPLVKKLLDIISVLNSTLHERDELIQELKDQIAVFKGEKPKPKIQPSRLEPKGGDKQTAIGPESLRPGSLKRSKTKELVIHSEVTISPAVIPLGSVFKGYDEYVVQDIVIRPKNVKYCLARWKTPDGVYVVGQLPAHVKGGHFGPTLVSYILYQHHHNLVTQPRIYEELREWGVDISAGQIDRILTNRTGLFHQEKDEILRAGLAVSSYLNVDDTGARHKGKNGYCTHIGNELFAWFHSSEHKNRINFLELLRAGHSDYVVNDSALDYMRAHKLPDNILALLTRRQDEVFPDKAEWAAWLQGVGVIQPRHVKIATEGALIGSILSHGVSKDLVIVSDDAGQFDVLLHALCWIHAERSINRLLLFDDDHQTAAAGVRDQIWDLYNGLKVYKTAPDEARKNELCARFEAIFTQKTCCSVLNAALKRIHNNKAELLLVLDRPDIPLHNNTSETDIRDYANKRKMSGGTRSDLGRQCRDTFMSLKKTCRKSGITFWEYLVDRVSNINGIPPLAQIIRQRALSP